MKNILLIDDDYYKRENYKESLSEIYKDDYCNFSEFKSRNMALEFMKENYPELDLIILDWNFPIYENSFAIPDAGDYILNFLKKMDANIDVIICSREEATPEVDYSNIIGFCLYQDDISLTDEFRKIIQKNKIFVKEKNK